MHALLSPKAGFSFCFDSFEVEPQFDSDFEQVGGHSRFCIAE